jgi:hypothetical protein
MLIKLTQAIVPLLNLMDKASPTKPIKLMLITEVTTTMPIKLVILKRM